MKNNFFYQVYNQYPDLYREKISRIENGRLILASEFPNENKIVIVKKYGDKNNVPRNMRNFTFEGNEEGLLKAKEKCKNRLEKQLSKYTDKKKGKDFIKNIARQIVDASERNEKDKEKLIKEICMAINSMANEMDVEKASDMIKIVDYTENRKLKEMRERTLYHDSCIEEMKYVFGSFYSVEKDNGNIFIREGLGSLEDADMVRKWSLRGDVMGTPITYEQALSQLKRDYMSDISNQASEIDKEAGKLGVFATRDKKENIARKRVDNYLRARELCEINKIGEDNIDEDESSLNFLSYDIIKKLPNDIIDKMAGREHMMSFENGMEYVIPKIMTVITKDNFVPKYFYKLMKENKIVGHAELNDKTGKLQLVRSSERGKIQLYERIDNNVTDFRRNMISKETDFKEVSCLDTVRSIA